MIRKGSKKYKMLERLTTIVSEQVHAHCAICYQPYSQNNPAMIICINQHTLCRECIHKMRSASADNKCPCSRQPVDLPQAQQFRLNNKLIELVDASAHFRSTADPKADSRPQPAPFQHNRIFYQPASIPTIIARLKTNVELQIGINRPLIGLGNLIDIELYLDYLPPLQALTELGHDPSQLSTYDLLSFYLTYDDSEKYEHEEWYKQRLEVDFQNVGLRLGLAHLYFNSYRFDEAYRWYKKCLLLLPTSNAIIQFLAISASHKGIPATNNYYLQKLQPNTWGSILLRPISKFTFDESIQLAQKMVRAQPRDGTRWMFLYTHYQILGDKHMLKKIKQDSFKAVKSPFYLWDFWNNQDDLSPYQCDQLKVKWIKKQICATSNASRAFLLYQLQDLTIKLQSSQLTSLLIERKSSLPDSAILEYAIMLFIQGKIKEAWQLLTRESVRLQRVKWYYHVLGLIENKLGNMEAALACFKKSLVQNQYLESYRPLMACCERLKYTEQAAYWRNQYRQVPYQRRRLLKQ